MRNWERIFRLRLQAKPSWSTEILWLFQIDILVQLTLLLSPEAEMSKHFRPEAMQFISRKPNIHQHAIFKLVKASDCPFERKVP
jgi:hypothetical protein